MQKINFIIKKMNLLLCNRCKKNSDDNILSLNSSETLKINNKQKSNNDNINIINQINQTDTSDKFLPFEDLNINDLEDDDDDLKIIEYPYKQIEKKVKLNTNKLMLKEFTNNRSKFSKNDSENDNENYLVERDIINRLNYICKNNNSNKAKNLKSKISNKIIDKKDTLTDPSNLALSSLINDINKINKKKHNILINKTETKEKEKEEINSTENKSYYNNFNKGNNKSTNKTEKSKYSRKVKRMEYSKNLINKKKLLKNKDISNNSLYKNSLRISNLIINSKKKAKNIPKSYSFNSFKIGNIYVSRKVRDENYNKYDFNLNLQNNKKMKTTIFSPNNKKKD